MFKRFLALLNARNKEFLRDRSSLSWNIIMPVLIIVGFAFAFNGDFDAQYKVGVAKLDEAKIHIPDFLATEYIEFIAIDDSEKAKISVQRHQLDMLVDVQQKYYWVNDQSPNGYLVEKIMQASDAASFVKQTVSGREIRYVDWVIPGVLSMNMMFSALFGVGYVIVRYRKNGMLKRLKATPLSAFEYLSVQIVSRLILIMLITVLIFYGTHIFIDYAMYGSHLNLFLIFALGTVSMISLSLVVAARITSEEAAGGLLNLVSWPMMFLSGVWFSLEGANPILQQVAQVFPLTHVTDAARAIMIDGAGLLDVMQHIIVLVVQAVIFLLIGTYTFRWE